MRINLRFVIGIVCVVVLIVVVSVEQLSRASATEGNNNQSIEVAQGATSTPAPVILPSGTATIIPPTDTPTRTPTSAGPGFIEANNPDTNVRIGPGTDTDRIGQIQPGQRFVVTGRYFRWFRIEFPESPNGVGWVFETVITFTGDIDQVPDLTQEELPTPDETQAAAQETAIAVTLTPGGILTVTSEALVTPEGVFTLTPQIGAPPTLAPGERLPTFTFPPFTPTPVSVDNLQETVQVNDGTGGVPPLLPIAALGGLGLMGLLVAVLRRF